ncbi:MAG: hypothetical protein LBL45_07460 [Treponema sp.]|jgi:hypothetical protein|nr:hypothetical protein [Treponema sp.]
MGIPSIKPWADRNEFWKRVAWSEEVGAMAIATDIDAIGLGYQYSGGKNERVRARSLTELKKMRQRIEGPFIISGKQKDEGYTLWGRIIALN